MRPFLVLFALSLCSVADAAVEIIAVGPSADHSIEALPSLTQVAVESTSRAGRMVCDSSGCRLVFDGSGPLKSILTPQRRVLLPRVRRFFGR